PTSGPNGGSDGDSNRCSTDRGHAHRRTASATAQPTASRPHFSSEPSTSRAAYHVQTGQKAAAVASATTADRVRVVTGADSACEGSGPPHRPPRRAAAGCP